MQLLFKGVAAPNDTSRFTSFAHSASDLKLQRREIIDAVVGAERVSVELINISNRGALVIGAVGAVGHAVELCVPGLGGPVRARVVRRDSKTISVKFDTPIGIVAVSKCAA